MVTTIYSRQSGIVVPITTASRRVAQRFAQQCSTPEKADQVRQNTLAVCAVNDYLQLLSIPTDLDSGDSWNPIMRLVTNVADLELPSVGTLSCRPVAADSDTCHIPPEEWHDRAGYIAVGLDEENYRATLLGFSAAVPQAEYVPIGSFDSIETLIDRVHQLRPSQSSVQSSSRPLANEQLNDGPPALNRIGQWVDGIITNGWRTAAEIINPTDLTLSFRTSVDQALPDIDTPTTVSDISRAKIVDLGMQLGQSIRAALVVYITQAADRRTSVILQVCPLGERPYLAEGIELNVLDDSGAVYLEARSRAIDNYIQLRFMGQPGEQFGVCISLGENGENGENVFREQFVI